MTEVEPAIAIGGARSGLDSPAIETSSAKDPLAEQPEDTERDAGRDMERGHAVQEPQDSGSSQDLAPNGDSGVVGRSRECGVSNHTEGGAAMSAVPSPDALELESVNTATASAGEPTAATEETRSGESEPEPTPLETTVDAKPAAPVRVRSLRSLIESELVSLDRYHRKVLDSGEPEAIHKMRVITRKLQAAIDLLEFKPDQRKIREIKKRLRSWRRSLSRVRNYDVFLRIVEKETLARRPGGRRPYELIGTELEKRRIKNLRRARSELAGIRIADLASKLGLEMGHSAGTGCSPHPIGTDALQVAGPSPSLMEDETKIAARAFDRLRQRLAEFQAKALSTHSTDHPTEIHSLRISAKRLRYLIEALSQMGYGESGKAVEWLKATQDRLGDLHDVEAFGDEIVRIAARTKFVKKHMAEAGEMLQAASSFLARREGLRTRFLPVRVPPVLGAASSRLTKSVSAGPQSRDAE